MKSFLRCVVLLSMLATALLAQGVVTYPFSASAPPAVPSANVTCSTTGVQGPVTYYPFVTLGNTNILWRVYFKVNS